MVMRLQLLKLFNFVSCHTEIFRKIRRKLVLEMLNSWERWQVDVEGHMRRLSATASIFSDCTNTLTSWCINNVTSFTNFSNKLILNTYRALFFSATKFCTFLSNFQLIAFILYYQIRNNRWFKMVPFRITTEYSSALTSHDRNLGFLRTQKGKLGQFWNVDQPPFLGMGTTSK